MKRGDAEYWVRPIAKWVVGADGRVDLEGGEGPFILVCKVDEGAILHQAHGSLIEKKDIDGWFWVNDSEPWEWQGLTGDLFRSLATLCL